MRRMRRALRIATRTKNGHCDLRCSSHQLQETFKDPLISLFLPFVTFSSDYHFRPSYIVTWWLSSRLVSVLDSGSEGPGFKSQSRRCRVSLRQTVHTHCASVHQAAKLVAALLKVVGVTAGLVESNDSLPPGL